MGTNDRRTRTGSTAGTAFAAGAALTAATAHAAPSFMKKTGETKVVTVLGTTEHLNGIHCELALRNIFEAQRDWRIIAVRSAAAFTPSLIGDADLLIIDRDSSPDTLDMSAGDAMVSDGVTAGRDFWTDGATRAIIDNVRDRGMGLIALGGTAGCEQFDMLDFLDIAPVRAHALEPVWYTRFNGDHEITRGTGRFAVMLDGQPLVIIKSHGTATLFESTAVHEKRQGVSGWALDRGNGRIAGLLPGRTIHALRTPEYRAIIWRAAHWAMKRDIPPFPGAVNRYYP